MNYEEIEEELKKAKLRIEDLESRMATILLYAEEEEIREIAEDARM